MPKFFPPSFLPFHLFLLPHQHQPSLHSKDCCPRLFFFFFCFDWWRTRLLTLPSTPSPSLFLFFSFLFPSQKKSQTWANMVRRSSRLNKAGTNPPAARQAPDQPRDTTQQRVTRRTARQKARDQSQATSSQLLADSPAASLPPFPAKRAQTTRQNRSSPAPTPASSPPLSPFEEEKEASQKTTDNSTSPPQLRVTSTPSPSLKSSLHRNRLSQRVGLPRPTLPCTFSAVALCL